MSIRNALIKLCACATGGALFGGGAVHIGAIPSSKPAHVTARVQPRSGAPRIRVTSATHGRAQQVVRRLRRVQTKRVTTVTYPPQAIQIATFGPPSGAVASTPVSAAPAARSERGGGYFGGGYFGGWSGGGGAGGSIVMVSANASASSTSSASASASASSSASSSSSVTTPPPEPGRPGEHPHPPGGHDDHGPPPTHVDVPAPPIYGLFGLASLGLVFGWGRRRPRAAKLS